MPDETTGPRRPWLPLLLVAIVCSVGFAALNDRFLTGFNIYVVLSSATLLALIGYAQLATLGVGDFSLAVGGIGEFTGIVLGYLLHTAGWSLAGRRSRPRSPSHSPPAYSTACSW